MPDQRAVQIIKMAEMERNKAANFMSLYQQVADLCYPLENQITMETTPGQDKSLLIRDPTQILALDDMVAGFVGTWVSEGRHFFGLKVQDPEVSELEHIKRWLAKATAIAHDEIFGSNFMLQLHNTVKALGAFGTGCLFSEFNVKTLKLNYKDWHISTYTIKQDETGNVDTVILNYNLTARQAAEKWENPGQQVLEAANDSQKESDVFEFIHIVRPRTNRTVRFTNNLNMPFESLFVNVKEKEIVEESGYKQLPYAVSRWEKSSTEKYGRGRGTVMLSAIKELQQMAKDILEYGNRLNRPPVEVMRIDVEGEVNMAPDGQTDVMQPNAIRPLFPNAGADFGSMLKILEAKQLLIKEGFYGNTFNEIRQLKGDRRTTVEINARLKEGLRLLISPVARQETELFTPVITRSVLLLMENNRIPEPPDEIKGKPIGIEYLGELAMAMRDYHARAFAQFVGFVGELAPIFPEAPDVINLDRALPNIGMTLGMRIEDLNTKEEKAKIRKDRADALAKQEALEAAQVAAKAYKEGGNAPEAGSASEAVQEMVGV